MAITPHTDVILLKCPLELDEKNQLNFNNAQDQYNYFYNLPKNYIGDDFKYQRKDQLIRVDLIADELYQYNYVMYRNTNYSNKWFYAFIDKIEYVNDNCTYIYISTDTYQTWMFDLKYKPCFVEREHVNDDSIGALNMVIIRLLMQIIQQCLKAVIHMMIGLSVLRSQSFQTV